MISCRNLVFASALGTTIATSGAAECLDNFAGTWEGSGEMTQNTAGESEEFRCQFRTEQIDPGSRSFGLRCASLSASRTLEFLLECDAEGQVRSFQISKPMVRVGEASELWITENSLALIDAESGELRLARNENRIDLTIEAENGFSGRLELLEIR